MSLDYLLDNTETRVTRNEAINEVKSHHSNVTDFLEEMGDHQDYNALEVLYWLGY